MRQRTDPLALGAGEAARDEPLDAEVLVDDAEGGIFGMGEFADAIRDELEDSIQVQDTGDAASGRVDRRQLVGGLTGASPRPGRTEDDLQATRTLVHREDGSGRRVKLEPGQDAVTESKLVAAQTGGLRFLVEQASGSKFHLGKRRRLEVEVPATQARALDDAAKRPG